jgi:hypothetical protein
MLTCIVCGGLVLAETGGVFTVMDGWIGLHKRDCQDAFKVRFHRLIDEMQREFAGERVERQWMLPASLRDGVPSEGNP